MKCIPPLSKGKRLVNYAAGKVPAPPDHRPERQAVHSTQVLRYIFAMSDGEFEEALKIIEEN